MVAKVSNKVKVKTPATTRKKHKITSDTKVLSTGPNGALTNSPSKKTRMKQGSGRSLLSIVVSVIFLIVAISLGGYFWNYYFGSCGVQRVIQAKKELDIAVAHFKDVNRIAYFTSQVVLVIPVSEMQHIRWETDGIEVPNCLESPKELIVKGMQNYIEAVILLMGAQDGKLTKQQDIDYRNYIFDAGQQFAISEHEIQDIMECVPFCKPNPYERVVP